LAEQARSASAIAEGLYAPDVNARVYEHLAHCVADVLGGGYTVIVDAAFLRREQRARFRELAAALDVELHVLHCHAPAGLLRTRIRERALRGTDASEADLSVLTWQQAHQDPLHSDEGFAIIDVDTGAGAPIAEVLRGLAATPESTSPPRLSAV
jgi:predicted kinase